MAIKQKERPGVMLYFDDVRPVISRLDVTQCGVLLRSVMDYAQYGVVPELDPMTGLAFDMLVPKIDRDAERYEESREQRQYAGYVREKKRSGEPALSIAEWRLARLRAGEPDNGPIRPDNGSIPPDNGPILPDNGSIPPDNGPIPSTSASATTTASASPSAPASPSASPSASSSTSLFPSADTSGEGCKGEGEARRVFAEWLRALDTKDKLLALKLDGQLYSLGYQTDKTTRQLTKRPRPR